MSQPVTDPELLAQLNADTPVTDPALLAQLNGGTHPSDSVLKTIDNYVRAAANGMTFGLADRFAAGMGSATGIGGNAGDYGGNLQTEQNRTDQFSSEHPIGNIAAQTAGALSTFPVSLGARAVQGAGLLSKTLGSAGLGAGLGAAGGGLSSHDWTNLPQTMRDATFGAGAGGLLGAALPAVGAGLGAGYNGIANAFRPTPGISRGAVPHLLEAYKADSPAAIQAQLERLGPDAMLADTGPALLGKAQGASLNSDEARSVLQGALTKRNEGTNQRIMGDVNQALGPAEDPQVVTNAIREHRTAVDNAAYPAALDNAPAVDTAPILRQLDAMIPKSVGMEKKALENMRGMLTLPEQRAAASVAEQNPVASTAEQIRQKYGDGAAAAFERQNQPKAQSLLEFLASKGGLGPDAELEAIGGHGHTVNVEGVGRRKLVRQGGWPLDYAREAAEEAGYLHGDHNGTSTVNNLLDAIDAEMRGQKRYPQGFEGTGSKRETTAISEREQHELDRRTLGFEADLADAGHGQIGAGVKQRAIDLMANKGMDADTAVEHAVRQLDNGFPGDRAKAAAPASTSAANKPTPQTDASVLHKIKQELDNVIQYDAPGLGVPAGALTRQQGTLKLFRGQLNTALENQVKGYKEANAASAALAKRGQAVEAGTQYLGSGKTTPFPERFAGEFNPLSQGEKIAFAKGSRGNIERVLGTKANDLQALRSELQGEGGFNTAKLATVHGQEAADKLIGSVERNLKFRETYGNVVANSQTAQRQAAARSMKPEPSSETPLINPNMTMAGLPATIAKKAVGAAFNAMLRKDPTKAFGEVARVLSAQGPHRDAYHRALVDALNKRVTTAAASSKGGNAAALTALVAVNAYLRGRSNRPAPEN